MDVSTEADVIGEIPARVIGIVVDDDGIGAPQPVVHVPHIEGRHAEIPAIEEEAAGTAAPQMIDVIAPDRSLKTTVFEWSRLVKPRIVMSGMADPFVVLVHVGRFRVATLIPERSLRRAAALVFRWTTAPVLVLRAMGRNVVRSVKCARGRTSTATTAMLRSTTAAPFMLMLRIRKETENESRCRTGDQFIHVASS